MEHAAQLPELERVHGEGRVAFHRRGPVSGLAQLHQSGSAKIRMPRKAGLEAEAVLINTAGGLTGGDCLSWQASAGANTYVTLTTPAAEKAYRSAGGQARISVRLALGEGARLDWLPQETILFQQARLHRTIEADLASGSSLLLAETVMFGRQAMGEVMTQGSLSESWRVRRQASLLHAEECFVDAAQLSRPALGAGAAAMGFILYCAPDAQDRLDAVRTLAQGLGGASAFAGKLTVRLICHEGLALRQAMAGIIATLRREPLPRLWFT